MKHSKIFKKLIKLSIMALCLTSAIFMYGPVRGQESFSLTVEEKTYLETLKGETFTFGSTSDLTYYIDNDGTPKGIAAPVIELLRSWGVDIEVKHYGWQENFDKLDSQDIDLLGLAILNNERCLKYACTNNLFNADIGIYTLNNSTISNAVELEGLTVGLVSNSALPKMIEVYLTPTGKIKYYETVEELFGALVNEEVDCVATSLTVQVELLKYENIVFGIAIDSFATPQGIYANNDKLVKLIDILNRYINSDDGTILMSKIPLEKREGIIYHYKKMHSKEISFLQQKYQSIKLYDSSTLYPLSFYDDNGKYTGLQADINRLFTELTDVKIDILTLDNYSTDFSSVLSDIKNDTIQGAIGIYRTDKIYHDPTVEYSRTLMSDSLSLYVRRDLSSEELNNLKIGTVDFGDSYFDISNYPNSSVIYYNNRTDLIKALNDGKINAIFTGELTIDYLYTICNDYTLTRFNNSLVPANVNILLNSDNEELNHMLNLSINLLSIIEPSTYNYWTNNTLNSKFETISLRNELLNSQNETMNIVLMFSLILIIALAAVYYHFRKFSKYDKQISEMLSAQHNMDMIWGNLKTKKVISKADFPFFRNRSVNKEYKAQLVDFDMFKEEITHINKNSLQFYEKEVSIIDNDGKTISLKQYTHPINANKFMSMIIDISAEKSKENELTELANTDGMTHLLNRRAMNNALEGYIKNRTKRLFIMMFDLDDFKHVNDNYGHDIGDMVLMAASKCIHDVCESGSVARWGGEEFLVAIELETLEDAIDLATTVLNDFESIEISFDNKVISSTISCGIGEVEDEDSCEFAIYRADSALYKAKANNKNNVQYISKKLDPNALLPTYYEEKSSLESRNILVSAIYNKIMGKVIQAFFVSRDTSLVIDELLRIVCDAFEMDRAYLYDKVGNELVRTHTYQPNSIYTEDFKNIPIDSLDWHSISEVGSIKFVENSDDSFGGHESDYRPSDIKSYVQFPIIVDNTFVGLCGFSNHEARIITDEDRRILSDIAGIMNEIVIRQSLERQLIISNTSLKSILDSIDEIVYVVEHETRQLLYANKKLRVEYNLDDYAGKVCWEVLRPDLNGVCSFCQHNKLCGNGNSVRHELYNTLAGKWFDITDTLIDWEGGRKAVVMVCLDITTSKEAAEQSKQMLEELKLKTAVNSFALATAKGFSWQYSITDNTIEFSSEIENIVGYPSEYFSSFQKYFELISDDIRDDVINRLTTFALEKQDSFAVEHPVITKDNDTRILFSRGRFFNEEKTIICGAAIDITESKNYERNLANLAYRDSLTGLYNLQYLANEAKIGQHPDFDNVGALLIDISRFKGINDVFGRSVGDKLLTNIGNRLQNYQFGDIKARVSGDRFLVIKENTSQEELLDYIKTVNHRAANAILDDGQQIRMELSIGVLITDETDIMKILQDTENALKYVKNESSINYHIIDHKTSEELKNSFINEFSLQRAIDSKQFYVVYQPLVYTSDETLRGAEALIRWKHPQYGIIPPGDFIPLAEESGLINQIGEFVIKEAIMQMRRWLDIGLDIKISLNLSAKQFLFSKLKDLIIDLIKEYNIPDHHLIVEVTESIMITDFDYITDTLVEFHDNGVLVALDDFGTGYSSIAYLAKLPLDILKIDRLFVSNAPKSEIYKDILLSIVAMAHTLELDIVAEGVETVEELAVIKESGCDIVQGYYYSKPLIPSDFEQFAYSFAMKKK